MSGIKLKLNTGVPRDASQASASATPAPTPGGSIAPRLKFFTKSTPSTPAPIDEAPKPRKTKAGRTTKPSTKLIEGRKRGVQSSLEDHPSDSENDGSTIAVQHPAKKVKLSFGPKTPATPIHIKPKIKGKPPKHPPGDGYDSEASDREIDPTIEEEFVLRMPPGDDCEYLREAIAGKKIGMPVSQGGADITMKFYHQDGRRASINIRGHLYAATLVDLPCIIEGMKSWDKRGWWKAADICQMLWVFAPITKEEEAKTIALPKIVDPNTFQYPHGLTPPMHYARKRRFRKRISRTAIEAVEAEVERLLEEDRLAESTRCEMFDADEESRRESAFSPESSPGYDAQGTYSEDDAEGEVDDGYFGQSHAHTNGGQEEGGEDDGDLGDELEGFLQTDDIAPDTPMSTVEGATPQANGHTGGESSGDESVGDVDGVDEGDSNGELSEDEKARRDQHDATREIIRDLKEKIAIAQAACNNPNAILRKRMENTVRNLKTELQLKKSSIEGEGGAEEDDDEE
ncbi:Transcription initiation factor TFIID subunit [Lachnellula suecica]|uniref:Transcription initiation factor TFIID subunit n=1 Tax=Lachnellula suecica TaxID=602035 RepID=A0A8T9C3X1_9HELO|nr:Transcription initiation factor TFIID subunit [Lachnellula suecica]